MILERLTEIALKQVRQVVPVLEGDRIVEPIAFLERRHRFRVRGRLLAEIGRDWVARHELGQRERDQRDPQTEENKGARAAQQEAKERRQSEAAHGKMSIVAVALQRFSTAESRAESARPPQRRRR